MSLIQTGTILVMLLSGAAAMGLAATSWQRRPEKWAVPFTVLMVLMGNWAWGGAIEFSIPSLEAKLFWVNVQYLSIAFFPVALLVFALAFVERNRWLARKYIIALSVIPAITLLLAWADHNLMRVDYYLSNDAPFEVIFIEYGPWFWVHIGYSYLAIVMTVGLFLYERGRHGRHRRRQIHIFLGALLIPIVGNVLIITKTILIDATALGFTISGIIMGYGLLRYQLFEVGPIARRLLVDNMRDLMIAIDENNIIVDVNKTAAQILNISTDQLLDQPITVLAKQFPKSMADYANVPELHGEEITIDDRTYDLGISAVRDGLGHMKGRLITLRDITSRKKAENELWQQKQLFEQLVSVARIISQGLAIQDTLHNILEVSVNLTSAERGSLILLNQMGSLEHSIVHHRVDNTPTRAKITQKALEKGLLRWVIEHRQPALIGNAQYDTRWHKAEADDYVTRSVLSLPIIYQRKLMGVLTLTNSNAQQFTGKHQRLMDSAVGQIALALRNSRNFEEKKQQAQRQEMLYELLKTLGRQRTMQTTSLVAVQTISRRISWWSTVFIAMPTESRHLKVTAHAGDLIHPNHEFMVDGSIVGATFRTGQRQTFSTAGNRNIDLMQAYPEVGSALAVPIQQDEKVLGVLGVFSEEAHGLAPEDEQLAGSLAEGIALALSNARYHDDITELAVNLDMLYTGTRNISRLSSETALLQEALNVSLIVTQFEMGLIALADDNGRLHLQTHQHVSDEIIKNIRENGFQETLCQYVYHTAEPAIISDIDSPTRKMAAINQRLPNFAASMQRVGLVAYLGIPLTYRGQSLGVICLFNRSPRHLSNDQLNLQSSLAQHTALTLNNNHLMETINRQRSRLQAIIDAGREGIILVDDELRILTINQNAVNFLQIKQTAEDWLGRTVVDVIRHLRRHGHNTAARRMIKQLNLLTASTTLDSQTSIGEVDIGPRTLEWRIIEVREPDRKVGHLVVLYDMTEERANRRARDAMTRTMVHDMRNPLSAAYTAVALVNDILLEEGQLKIDDLAIVDNISQGIDKALQLINEILDISRLESGRMPLHTTNVSVGELLNAVLQLQNSLINQKNISLLQDIDPRHTSHADPNLMERVLQNLIGNALKFTPPHGRIKIISRRREDGRIHLSIADSGDGIEEELQGRLFTKFTTGNHHRSGSGLGLAFCKMVLEAHGEKIWLADTSTKGTTFTMSLPPAA